MKNNKLFIIWGVFVVIIITLLTGIGFMLKDVNSNYKELEDKLVEKAKQYVDNRFLYPEGKEKIKVTTEDLINDNYLDELKYENDKCKGYVVVFKDGVYKYKGYISCEKYTTKGYKEN